MLKPILSNGKIEKKESGHLVFVNKLKFLIIFLLSLLILDICVSFKNTWKEIIVDQVSMKSKFKDLMVEYSLVLLLLSFIMQR